MPAASQETFRVRSYAKTLAEAHEIARGLTLEGVAQQIKCPLLVFGAGDKMIPAAEGERLARAASGPTDFVVFEEGNHVCFNISYKFRPLTADWTAERSGFADGALTGGTPAEVRKRRIRCQPALTRCQIRMASAPPIIRRVLISSACGRSVCAAKAALKRHDIAAAIFVRHENIRYTVAVKGHTFCPQ